MREMGRSCRRSVVERRTLGASLLAEFEIDALAVARAVVKDGPDAFAAAYLDEDAMRIRLLSDHRQDLVAERTRMQNRLRTGAAFSACLTSGCRAARRSCRDAHC